MRGIAKPSVGRSRTCSAGAIGVAAPAARVTAGYAGFLHASGTAILAEIAAILAAERGEAGAGGVGTLLGNQVLGHDTSWSGTQPTGKRQTGRRRQSALPWVRDSRCLKSIFNAETAAGAIRTRPTRISAYRDDRQRPRSCACRSPFRRQRGRARCGSISPLFREQDVGITGHPAPTAIPALVRQVSRP